MEAERWQIIERIYHLAADQKPPHRAAFLEQACNGDESLQREIESLLASEYETEEMLSRAVAQSAHSMLTQYRVGKVISHYRVIEKVDRGGMAEVYKAEDIRLGRPVALKFLLERRDRAPHALERLRLEARAASALNHPNICTIYDVEEHEGEPFIAMEFLDGQTLKDRLLTKPLTSAEVIHLGKQIADGLGAAHSRGIIHRDVKPANIFITTRGPVKILDFGLATMSNPDNEQHSLAPPGMIIGTVDYMSPEQARGEALDLRTDIFSFGAVLYEMATGHKAFRGASLSMVFNAILNHSPVPPLQLNSKLPLGLTDIIYRALEKNRNLRYQHAGEIRVDLERLSDWRTLIVSWLGKIWKFHKRSAMLLPLLILILAIAYGMLRPLIARWYNNRGAQLQQNGRVTSAIDKYRRALSLNPTYPEAHYNLADAYEETSDYDRAVAEYQMAIQTDDTFYEAYNNLSRLYILRRGDYAAALRLLDHALNSKPVDTSVQYSLHKNHGWANFGLGLFGQAERDLGRALALKQPHGAAHCLLALVWEAENRSTGREWEYCLAYDSGERDVESNWRSLAQERLTQEKLK